MTNNTKFEPRKVEDIVNGANGPEFSNSTFPEVKSILDKFTKMDQKNSQFSETTQWDDCNIELKRKVRHLRLITS